MAYEDILNTPLCHWRDDGGEKVEDYLTPVGGIELRDESWSFDMIRFYVRKADGQILYAKDSGCSCPMPFEDTLVKDLRETTLSGVEATVLRGWEEPDQYGGVSRSEIQRRIREVHAALKEAGGK